MIRDFIKGTPQAASIIAGLACACITLEALRMPAVRDVTFVMHHPIPYFFEAAALLALAMLLYRRNPEARLCDSPVVVISMGTIACLSLFYATQETSGQTLEASIAAIAYRVSSGLLFVLWGERLIDLGARRAAIAFMLATMAGALFLLASSLLDGLVAQSLIATLPAISMGALLSSRTNLTPAENKELSVPLPELPLKPKRAWSFTIALIMLPLVARAPFISVQSSWMDVQGGEFSSLLLQTFIALGWMLGAGLVYLVVTRLWNKYSLVFYVLVVPLLGLVALYATQASASLWFIYLPIIDASYRAVLLFVLIAPFMVEGRTSPASIALCLCCLIAARASLSWLLSALPAELYAGISIMVIVGCALGGAFALFASGFLAPPSPSPTPSAESEDSLVRACAEISEENGLTKRESEIIVLLAQHYNAPYIAKKLVLSVSTVKTHMRNLYSKLDVHSQADLLLLIENRQKQTEDRKGPVE